MRIGNQGNMAVDWSSLQRERMSGARAGLQGAEGASFGEALAGARGGRLDARLSGEKRVPYSYLDEGGTISYNGVTFVCDYEWNRICLGDVSDRRECLNIPLSEGGCLVVNRDNLGDLSKAMGMFSPEDVNRIMRAIAQDTKCQQELQKIDEVKNSIGEDGE